jgi:acetyl-CoA C-acetyltransferase
MGAKNAMKCGNHDLIFFIKQLLVLAFGLAMNTLICTPKRTALGSFLGSLSELSAPDLGAIAIKGTLAESKIDAAQVDEVYMGCVLSAGVGQAPARQAAMKAGLSNKTPCTTVSKVCGSGLKAVMLADQSIRAGDAEVIVAGGMESMSQSPFLIQRLRTGLRMGNGELTDSMIKDGLWDVYNNFHMGEAAEILNREKKISRQDQDAFAIQSYKRALGAQKDGLFKNEIVAVEIKGKKAVTIFDQDEEPGRSDLEKIPGLRPVFSKEGSITAANASSINDGASAMIVCSEAAAKRLQLKPMARIVGQAQAAQDPAWFTTAPALSIERLLQKAGLKKDQIDLWEINEAFASVAIINMQMLGLDPERVNVFGGAVALGHPIGASGARILTTLAHALTNRRGRYGVASLCIGGGEAVSLLIERV